jgi:hypothetical protein
MKASFSKHEFSFSIRDVPKFIQRDIAVTNSRVYNLSLNVKKDGSITLGPIQMKAIMNLRYVFNDYSTLGNTQIHNSIFKEELDLRNSMVFEKDFWIVDLTIHFASFSNEQQFIIFNILDAIFNEDMKPMYSKEFFSVIVKVFSTNFNHYFFALMPLFLAKLITFLDPVSRLVSTFNMYNDVKSNEVGMFDIMNKALVWDKPEEKRAYADGAMALERAWLNSFPNKFFDFQFISIQRLIQTYLTPKDMHNMLKGVKKHPKRRIFIYFTCKRARNFIF